MAFPRSGDVGGSEIIVVVALPTREMGCQQKVDAVFLEHSRRLTHAFHISNHGVHAEIVVTEAVNGPMMTEQITSVVIILEDADVPFLIGLPLYSNVPNNL